jgi:dolichyl-phosphate beta-glucosyltransferase
MLREAVEYLETCSLIVESDPLGKTEQKEKMRRVPTGIAKGSYEVLIVDDGSRDGTSAVALELASELEKRWSSEKATDGTVVPRPLRGVIKVVKLIRNRGKGGCVKHASPRFRSVLEFHRLTYASSFLIVLGNTSRCWE